MKWFLENLRNGRRLAYFRTTPAQFKSSWHALMAVAAVMILSQFVIEFAYDGPGGALSYSWQAYPASLLIFFLVASYAIALLMRQVDAVLPVAVAFLNSYYFVFILYIVAKTISPETFYKDGVGTQVLHLAPIWAFLVMFRLAGTIFKAETLKLVLAGLIAAGTVYYVNFGIYFTRIYYVEHEEDEVSEATPLDTLTSEEVFDLQANLREKDLKQLEVSKPGQTDIYGLALGTYAYQSVFKRDVTYVSERLKSRMGINNVLPMINNSTTVDTVPLATTSNLKRYLHELSSHYLQPKEDVVFIYLTSHGSAKTGLSVNLGYSYTLLDIYPRGLKRILDESGIQNRVIVIAACYSGVFIPALQDEHTMVITAAAKDRVSFGCSDSSNLTYFTQAYFMDGLEKTSDFEKAFAIARDAVLKREASEGITEHSDPQIFVGSKIREVLSNYYKHVKIPSPPQNP